MLFPFSSLFLFLLQIPPSLVLITSVLAVRLNNLLSYHYFCTLDLSFSLHYLFFPSELSYLALESCLYPSSSGPLRRSISYHRSIYGPWKRYIRSQNPYDTEWPASSRLVAACHACLVCVTAGLHWLPCLVFRPHSHHSNGPLITSDLLAHLRNEYIPTYCTSCNNIRFSPPLSHTPCRDGPSKLTPSRLSDYNHNPPTAVRRYCNTPVFVSPSLGTWGQSAQFEVPGACTERGNVHDTHETHTPTIGNFERRLLAERCASKRKGRFFFLRACHLALNLVGLLLRSAFLAFSSAVYLSPFPLPSVPCIVLYIAWPYYCFRVNDYHILFLSLLPIPFLTSSHYLPNLFSR